MWTAQKLRRVADRYMRDSCDRESPPQVNELAALLGLSRSRFSRLFAQLVGEPPSAYLRRRQIARAKHLLRTTDLTTNTIAYRCGYSTRSTLFHAFKQATGITPKKYRARVR